MGMCTRMEVRLSPAGDGAEDVEETCEKQKRTAWWVDVLVGERGAVRLRDFF